jgi:hypothetical protein
MNDAKEDENDGGVFSDTSSNKKQLCEARKRKLDESIGCES